MIANHLISIVILGLALWHNCAGDDLQNIRDKINEIPGLENFNQSLLPSVDEIKNAVNEKCKKSGGSSDGFDKIKSASESFQTCIQGHFNASQIQSEVEEAKKTGSMDEVFAKYCAKIPTVKQCAKKLNDAITPCLDEDEKESFKVLTNITESVATFICHKDGDRIAMFIAEGGVECIDSKKENIQKCINTTLGPRIPSNISINNIPTFKFDDEKCKDLTSLQTCVVTELEKCKDYTPANIVDALFKFVRRVSPCKKN